MLVKKISLDLKKINGPRGYKKIIMHKKTVKSRKNAVKKMILTDFVKDDITHISSDKYRACKTNI